MATRRMSSTLPSIFPPVCQYKVKPMDAATERVAANVLVTFLAGLQAGMVAAFWMLVWLGISGMWMRRSFWSAANTMATALHGDSAIHPGFASTTLSGIALYLLL